MCLIIHKPAGETVDRWIIDSAYYTNSDGFGIMAQGKAQKWKDRKPAQIEDILADFQDVDCAIHFRMATHGKVNKANAHPFRLQNRAYLMHNGVLGKYTPTGKMAAVKSDTREFVDKFCNPAIKKHGSIPSALLEAEIYGNTICIMQKDGVINRYGSGWVKHYGCYFSNEYAWDSPTYSAWDKFKGSSVIHLPSDTGDYDAIPGHSDNGIASQMLWSLEQLVDVLPFNDSSYIAYEDIQLQDELLECEITPEDFLEFCTDETLLALYSWAIGNGLIGY